MLILNITLRYAFFLYLFASSSDNLDCDGFCFITFVKVDLGILKLEIWEYAWEVRILMEIVEERNGEGIKYK